MTTLPETVSPLEILWTIITFAGAAAAAWNCWDAWGDLIAVLAERRNGALLTTGKGEVIDQFLILFVLLCECVSGILAMFALPGREPDGDPSLSSMVVPWLFILAALALIALSFGKKYRRRLIMEHIREYP